MSAVMLRPGSLPCLFRDLTVEAALHHLSILNEGNAVARNLYLAAEMELAARCPRSRWL